MQKPPKGWLKHVETLLPCGKRLHFAIEHGLEIVDLPIENGSYVCLPEGKSWDTPPFSTGDSDFATTHSIMGSID